MTRTIRILCLEDDRLDAELIHETLDQGGFRAEIDVVDTRRTFEKALTSAEYDLILADRSLPSFDGLDALEIATRYRSEVPFIFVSGVMGEETAIRALKQGATDYVLKNNLEKLCPAVLRALNERMVLQERQLAEQREQIALAALRTSEQRYDRLTARMNALIFEIAPNGAVHYVNQAVERITGRSVMEVLSSNWLTLYFPDERLQDAKDLMSELARGDVTNREIWLTSKDGSLCAVELNTANVYDSAGRLERVVGFAIDISARKLAEAASSGSHMFLRSVLNALPSAIAVLDGEGRIIAANRAWNEFNESNGGTVAMGGIGANFLEACQEHTGMAACQPVDAGATIREVIAGTKASATIEYQCYCDEGKDWIRLQAIQFEESGPGRAIVIYEPM